MPKNMSRASELRLLHWLINDVEKQTAAYAELQQRIKQYLYCQGSERINRFDLYKDDIVAATIQTLYDEFETFNGNSRSFKHYLKQTVFNHSQTFLRMVLFEHAQVEPLDKKDEHDFSAEKWLASSSAGDRVEEDQLQIQRFEQKRKEAFAQLATGEQRLLSWVTEEALSNIEIATRLQCSQGLVAAQLKRARRRYMILILREIAQSEQEYKLMQSAEKLPAPYQIIVQGWLAGATLTQLRQKLPGENKSQSRLKQILKQGFQTLFHLLMQDNAKDKDHE